MPELPFWNQHLLRLVASFVVGHGRRDDRAVEVEDEELLGVGRLRDEVAERLRDAHVGRAPASGRGAAREDSLSRCSEPAGVAGDVAAEEPADEDGIAALLVEPTVEGVRLQLGRRVEPIEHLGLQRAPGPEVRDRADDADHQE